MKFKNTNHHNLIISSQNMKFYTYKTILLSTALFFTFMTPGYANPAKKDGFYRTYYIDGTLKSEIFYRDGKKEGSHKLYNKDGTLFSEIRYNNNQKIYDKTKNQDGNIVERWLKNGVVSRIKVYNRQNKLIEEGSFQKNLKHGVQKKLYPDGNIWIVSPYKKGLKHGTEKQYYQTGQLQLSSQYKNGARHGHSKTFDKEGNLKVNQIYINGKLKRDKPKTSLPIPR